MFGSCSAPFRLSAHLGKDATVHRGFVQSLPGPHDQDPRRYRTRSLFHAPVEDICLVRSAVCPQPGSPADPTEVAEVWRESKPHNIGPRTLKPQRKPASLETGVTGNQHLFLVPEGRIHRYSLYHIFQGALPEDHNSSRWVLSRKVSIGCQNPSCR